MTKITAKKKTTLKSCYRKSGDETYTFFAWQWNVSRLMDYIEKNQIESEEFPMSQMEGLVKFIQGMVRINEEYLPKVDIRKPGILLDLGKGGNILVDGNHRMMRAHQIGAESIPLYCIPFEIQVNFLTESFMQEAMLKMNKGED